MAQAFRYEETDGFGRLTFDLPGSRVNIFTATAMSELGEWADELERKVGLRGLVFASGKPAQFIAGADLNELSSPEMAGPAGLALAERGQRLFDRLSRLPFPIVAAIDGPCMGGGTELILALDGRVASAEPRTQIGLPEVTIGIIPGWGGTQRLPRLIGPAAAIDVICTGRPLSAAEAQRVGLIDAVVGHDELLGAARELVKRLAETGDWEAKRRRMQAPLEPDALPDELFADAQRRILAEGGHENPAPLAALQAIREGGVRSLDEGLAVERHLFAERVGSEVSRHLIAAFFTRQRERRSGR